MALAFHNVRFPTSVSFGSSGGPEFKTQVFISHKGYEKRNIEWSQPMMSFNVAYGIKTDTQMMEVLKFFNARQGKAYAFRYKNWGNYSVVTSPIATGDGVSKRFPLWKFYGFTGARHYKRLRKIVAGSVTGVGIGAVGTLVEGVDYSINYEEGEIALNAVIAYGVPIYGSLEFDEPVRFDEDNIQTIIDAYNNNSLNSLKLVSVRAPFTTGSLFAPTEVNTATDLYLSKTRLILNFDDISVLTTTVDDSALSMPMTVVGNAVLTTSARNSGSGSLSVGTGRVTTIGTPFDLSPLQPFTLEVFAQQPIATVGLEQQQIIGKWDENTNQRSWVLRYIKSTKMLQFVVSSNGTDERIIMAFPWESGSITDFEYITIDRLVNNWYVMRIRGEVVTSKQDFGLVNDSAALLSVGHIVNPGANQGPYSALIDSIRMTIGRARHTNFLTVTPPGPYVTVG